MRAELTAYIRDILDDITKAPAAYGPNIAVELQAVQLLRIYAMVVQPAAESLKRSDVVGALCSYINEHVPHASRFTALADVMDERGRHSEFTATLKDFIGHFISSLKPEHEDAAPTASSPVAARGTGTCSACGYVCDVVNNLIADHPPKHKSYESDESCPGTGQPPRVYRTGGPPS